MTLWLLQHFALAHERVNGDRDLALSFLEPLADLIGACGLGTLPEITDGDLPLRPRGCISQAWSVAEALRVYHLLVADRRRLRRRTPVRAAALAGV